MGWTEYHATHYNRNGVDRKAECDVYFMEGLNEGHYKVEKSTMVGSVYYAAVRKLVRHVGNDENGNGVYEPMPEEEQSVFGAVFCTSVDSKSYYNFSYKDMDETMGPYYCDCPNSILDILSPTENEYALAWREKCRERNEKKKILNKLPIGTVITVEMDGETVRYQKCKIRQGKKWVNWEKWRYINPNVILHFGYSVVN